jgi:hypothetical protein
MKEWLRRLSEIEQSGIDAQDNYRASFDRARRKEERKFIKDRKYVEERLSKTGESDARNELSKASVKEFIAREVNALL